VGIGVASQQKTQNAQAALRAVAGAAGAAHAEGLHARSRSLAPV